MTWEIGHHNAYGLATITFFVLLPAMYYRNCHPSPVLAVISLTTFALVVGYSWQNLVSPVALVYVGLTSAVASSLIVCPDPIQECWRWVQIGLHQIRAFGHWCFCCASRGSWSDVADSRVHRLSYSLTCRRGQRKNRIISRASYTDVEL